MARIACSIRKRITLAFTEFFLDFVILSATGWLAIASQPVKSKDPYSSAEPN
jgi:hypothetical protein